MGLGFQELLALAIVAVVVGFALYRRWRKPAEKNSCCGDTEPSGEKTVHFYRRDDG